jgi:hypothetical protein
MTRSEWLRPRAKPRKMPNQPAREPLDRLFFAARTFNGETSKAPTGYRLQVAFDAKGQPYRTGAIVSLKRDARRAA